MTTTSECFTILSWDASLASTILVGSVELEYVHDRLSPTSNTTAFDMGLNDLKVPMSFLNNIFKFFDGVINFFFGVVMRKRETYRMITFRNIQGAQNT